MPNGAASMPGAYDSRARPERDRLTPLPVFSNRGAACRQRRPGTTCSEPAGRSSCMCQETPTAASPVPVESRTSFTARTTLGISCPTDRFAATTIPARPAPSATGISANARSPPRSPALAIDTSAARDATKNTPKTPAISRGIPRAARSGPTSPVKDAQPPAAAWRRPCSHGTRLSRPIASLNRATRIHRAVTDPRKRGSGIPAVRPSSYQVVPRVVVTAASRRRHSSAECPDDSATGRQPRPTNRPLAPAADVVTAAPVPDLLAFTFAVSYQPPDGQSQLANVGDHAADLPGPVFRSFRIPR